MEIRGAASARFVRLEPTGYQFRDRLGDEFDDNWLMIRGHARSDDEEWTFHEPALLVDEARAMGDWMRAAATGTATAMIPDADGFTSPATDTIEPNIGMGLVGYDADTVTVRVFLWLESAPPSTWNHRIKTDMEYFVDISTTPDALEHAADECDRALADFPRRS